MYKTQVTFFLKHSLSSNCLSTQDKTMAGLYFASVTFVTLLCYSLATEDEPTCSKFMYDKQMLETMVRLEAKMNQWDRERKVFEENVLSILEHRRDEMERKFKKQNENLDAMLEKLAGKFIELYNK